MSYYQPPGYNPQGYNPPPNQSMYGSYSQPPPPQYNQQAPSPYGYPQQQQQPLPPQQQQPPPYTSPPPSHHPQQPFQQPLPQQQPISQQHLQLSELTLRWVSEAVSIHQIIDGVTSVAAMNKIAYFDSQRTFNDIASVIWETKRYALSAGEYFTNQGEIMNILQIKGLLSINFRGATYKTPIVVHVPTAYPNKAPIIYVTPTSDLRISPKCPYVQPDGLVVHQYLNSWTKLSTISQFLQQLAAAFGEAPPLFAAASSPSPVPQQQTQQQQQQQQQQYQPPIQQQQQPPRPIEPTPQQIEAKRRQELETIIEVKLASAQTEQYKTLKQQLETANKTKSELHRKGFIADFQSQSQNEQLEQYTRLNTVLDEDITLLQTLLANSQQQQQQQQQQQTNGNGDDILEDTRLSFEGYSKQLLLEDCTDSALDDVLVQLDQLLSDEKITIDAYQKEVRTLARKQFLARALARKIMTQM